MRLIHCNILKFQDKPILRTCQKSALWHSLFWRYANFSKIMRTIHTSMTSTFLFEFMPSFECKTLAFFIFNFQTTSLSKLFTQQLQNQLSLNQDRDQHQHPAGIVATQVPMKTNVRKNKFWDETKESPTINLSCRKARTQMRKLPIIPPIKRIKTIYSFFRIGKIHFK